MSRDKGTVRSSEEQQYLVRLGENIRQARKRTGHSQEVFADIAGFSRSYYTEIETGKRNISVLNLIKIMKALRVEPNEIIDFLEPK
jgi:transcriptional regulator with XRE-family HTH domain